MKDYYDNHQHEFNFKIGDLVKIFVRDMDGDHPKLNPYFEGPYSIIGFDNGQLTVHLEEYNCPEGREPQTRFIHCSRLMPYSHSTQ